MVTSLSVWRTQEETLRIDDFCAAESMAKKLIVMFANGSATADPLFPPTAATAKTTHLQGYQPRWRKTPKNLQLSAQNIRADADANVSEPRVEAYGQEIASSWQDLMASSMAAFQELVKCCKGNVPKPKVPTEGAKFVL